MTIDPQKCVICQTPDASQWTAWQLDEPIRWAGAFTGADEPPVPAGEWKSCPDCTRWIPRHRAGAMPAVVQQGIHAAVTVVQLHPLTRQKLHADLVGRLRHLAGQLRPVAEQAGG